MKIKFNREQEMTSLKPILTDDYKTLIVLKEESFAFVSMLYNYRKAKDIGRYFINEIEYNENNRDLLISTEELMNFKVGEIYQIKESILKDSDDEHFVNHIYFDVYDTIVIVRDVDDKEITFERYKTPYQAFKNNGKI